MGEIKSVKVDNWGVFFLQKLQNFFNKTDYCDLTLQFQDNSQLKVHRLVLSACTDYFNVLEQTCDIIDDALIMPNELQADVVVPIVNFMYTGTLEFELKMYGKLLRTAKEMNMTVLLKLLEAHRRTMEGVNRSQRPPSPKTIRRRGTSSAFTPSQQQSQQRRILTSANSTQQRHGSSTPHQYRQLIGSTSVQRTTPAAIHSQTLKQEIEDYKDLEQSSSTFEQLRKGYNNNKRPATSSFISPPAKKPNIEDVKEFAEQQRMRKQIAAEYGDDQEYEGMLDDDIHNYDDDDDGAIPATNVVPTPNLQNQDNQSCGATITFRKEQNDKPPTIVVRDSANSNMNHAKIIQEVLRQYPHLVKGNKNIKLKIMPNVGGQAQKIIVKKEPYNESDTSNANIRQVQQKSFDSPSEAVPIKIEKSPILPAVKLYTQRPSSSITNSAINTSAIKMTELPTTATAEVSGQKRRIDSKTMHALIALGAENVNGPWLCLRCGINGRPISIPSYRGFRRHLINTHKETIDPALCEHCGWRSANNRELHFHVQTEHKIKSKLYIFSECSSCSEIFIDTNTLSVHMSENHPEKNKQQCIYCNKVFPKEKQLYTHMKNNHKTQALEDGVIDFSDDDFFGSNDEFEIEEQLTKDEKKDSKVKIISDISLPVAKELLKLEPSSEAAALSTVATGIATSIGLENPDEFLSENETEQSSETKFVNADGKEMLLTEEQRKGIISQLNQEKGNGGVVMVLNEPIEEFQTEANIKYNASTANTETKDKPIHDINSRLTGDAENFNETHSYSELSNNGATQPEDTNTPERHTGREESKESLENLEWAENLVSEHELADDSAETPRKSIGNINKDDDITKKLKELTGDWSEDEFEDEQEDKTEVVATEKRVRNIQNVSKASIVNESSNKNDVTEENEQLEVKETITEEKDIEKIEEEIENDVLKSEMTLSKAEYKDDANCSKSLDVKDVEKGANKCEDLSADPLEPKLIKIFGEVSSNNKTIKNEEDNELVSGTFISELNSDLQSVKEEEDVQEFIDDHDPQTKTAKTEVPISEEEENDKGTVEAEDPVETVTDSDSEMTENSVRKRSNEKDISAVNSENLDEKVKCDWAKGNVIEEHDDIGDVDTDEL